MSNAFNNPGLQGNPHFKDVTAFSEPEQQAVSATLALAYEQRTATLAALFVAGFNAVQVNGVDYEALSDQIKERLGL